MADIKQIKVGVTTYNIEPYTSYLKLNGTSTMTGKLNLLASGNNGGNIGSNGIRWNSDSLPQDEAPQFVNTIDGFATGGRQKWCHLSTLKNALAVPTIDASTFNDVWNIQYESTTPNIYYVKDSSDNYLWVKPYKFTESIPGGQIYLRNSHLVQSDDRKMGEWGYITSSGKSQYYNYAASIKYVLYYDDILNPGTKTEGKATGDLRGNMTTEDKHPLILFDSATVTLVGSIYWENNKPYVYVWSTGTKDDYVELKVRLCLGEYNTSTNKMNWGLSIDYPKCVPNTGEDGAYTYDGNGVFTETYTDSKITISKTLYHYMCQKQLKPTVEKTHSPKQTVGAQISVGDTVYYQDVLDFNGILIWADNGFNNEWWFKSCPGVIDIPSISGSMDSDYWDFTFPNADMRYYKFKVIEKGCSSSSATSLSEYTDWYETIPYWFSSTYMKKTRYNFTKEATISGTVYFSGATKALPSTTVTNSSYPTVKAPAITGYIQGGILNDAGTSYIREAYFSVYNPNNFAVKATIWYARDGYSAVTKTETISAKSYYRWDQEDPSYNYMEVEAFFTAYGIDSADAYAEIENSTA